MTYERLKEMLGYDPETGIFTWVTTSRNANFKPGRKVGFNDQGYLRIKIDGVGYAAHRLAWLYMTGSFPKDFIDHKNGIRNDNRWCNIREANRSQNAANKSKLRSGLKGAVKVKGYNRWQAKTKSFGKTIYLGHYKTEEEAHQAYCAFHSQRFGEFARTT